MNTSTPSAVEVLKKAKALIADPEHWCQGVMAKNDFGSEVYPDDLDACRWCAEGGMRAVQPFGTHSFTSAWDLLKEAAAEVGYMSPVSLNDEANHPTVMKMFDRAIALAGGE